MNEHTNARSLVSEPKEKDWAAGALARLAEAHGDEAAAKTRAFTDSVERASFLRSLGLKMGERVRIESEMRSESKSDQHIAPSAPSSASALDPNFSWVREADCHLICVWHGREQSVSPPTVRQFHPAAEYATKIQSAWRGHISRQRLIKSLLRAFGFSGLAKKWGLVIHGAETDYHAPWTEHWRHWSGAPDAEADTSHAEAQAATKIQAVRLGKSVRMSFDTAGIAHPSVADLETYTDASGHWQKCNPKDWVVSSGIVDGRLWWDPLKEEVWYLIGSDVIVCGKDLVRPTTRQTTSVAAIKRWYGYEKPDWD